MGKRKDKDGKYRDRDERWIRKQISNFVEIGLIERSQKGSLSIQREALQINYSRISISNLKKRNYA